MKEQSKTPERGLSKEEIASLSDGECKVLVIKMLTDLIELGQKMKKQMKDTQSEIKQNVLGTNSDRKETRTQCNDLEQKEKINIQNKMKKQEFEKVKRDSYKPLGQPETFQYPNYRGARRRTTARN